MYKRILENKLRELSKSFPVVSVTGPRQSGKTTLCRMTFGEYAYLNLEDEESRAIMQRDIKGFLRTHGNGLIIDEAHFLPELFSALQVVCDEDETRRYVIYGSSNWLNLQNISISMSGSRPYETALVLSVEALVSVNTAKSQLNAGSIIPVMP